VVEDIHAIHPELSAKNRQFTRHWRNTISTSATAHYRYLGIDEAAWSALLARYPGKRFEIEALFVNPKFSIL
jgi:hypothetical protein